VHRAVIKPGRHCPVQCCFHRPDCKGRGGDDISNCAQRYENRWHKERWQPYHR
jgi:hypothetical protein